MNRDLPVLSGLWLLLLVPMLLLGAVHPQTLAITAILAAGSGMLLCSSRGCHMLKLDVVSVLLLTMLCATAIQLLPLPSPLVHLLSPTAWELRTSAAEALERSAPFWMPITLDATMTFQEFTRLLIYIIVYWNAAFVIRRQGTTELLKVVMIAGALCATVFLAHRILLLDRAWGVYEPLYTHFDKAAFSAPLLNPNHLGGFLLLTATVAIGLAVSSTNRSTRWIRIGISALIGGSLLLTLSRGAIGAFVAGQLVFISILIFRRWTEKSGADSRLRRLSFLPLGLALSLALGMFVAQDAIVGEFVNGNIKKIDILNESLPLMRDFVWTGVGRGAFFAGFPLVSDWAASANFTHAENIIVQLICDFGLPMGVFIVGSFITLGVIALSRLPRQARKAGAVAALLAIGIQNLVDFNLEITGVVVVAIAVLAVIFADETDNRPLFRFADRFRRPLTRAVVVPLSGLTFIAAIVCGLYLPSKTADAEERRAKTAFQDEDKEFFTGGELGDMIERHPASWYLPLLAGVHYFGEADPRTLRWLGRAVRINPHSPAAHFHIARALLSRGALSQALIECRLASGFNPNYSTHCAQILTRANPSFAALSPIATTDEERALLYDSLAAEFARAGQPTEAEKADLAALRAKKPREASFARQIYRMAAKGETAGARELHARMIRSGFDGPGAILLASEIARGSKDTLAEIQIVKKGLLRFPDDPMLLRHLVALHIREKNPAEAIKTCRILRALAPNEYQAALAVELEGDVENASGRTHSALSRYRQASAMVPENTQLLNKVLQAARVMGDEPLVREILLRMVELHPNDPVWGRALQDQEEKMQPADLN